MTGFRRAATLSAVLFLALLSARLGLLDSLLYGAGALPAEADSASARESWMGVYQQQRRIGYAHTRFAPRAGGSELLEEVRVRVTTMGLAQELRLQTRARLRPDLSLEHFEYELVSGAFRFRAEGEVSDRILVVHTETAGVPRRTELPVKGRIYLPAAVLAALPAERLKPGDRYAFDIFDPGTLGQSAVQLEIVEREAIEVSGVERQAVRVSMGLRGMTQTAWIAEDGTVLRERGLLGMRLENVGRAEALRDVGPGLGEDLAEAAAVVPDREVQDPAGRERLRVRLGGTGIERLQLNGGRQRLMDGVLAVERERLDDLPASAPGEFGPLERAFLRSEALIQSDHERVRSAVRSILGDTQGSPVEAARRLTDWVYRSIEKRPVLSLPDALSTLEHRMGDCNEHAVLLTALARAAGIPARVEAGVVYLRGRFYYHAWTVLYLGRWVTADAAFGQFPADVTHVRFVTGSAQQQMDLLGVMGNLTIEVVD